MIVVVTAYCAGLCCTPGHGLTASGFRPMQGVTVAAPRWVPFGTQVHIEGVGWRVVQDRLALRFDDRWDVYFARHTDARKFGVKRLRITR